MTQYATSSATADDQNGPASHVVVRAVDLNKHFAGVTALEGVTVEIRRGEVVGLVGQNGAGKSTLAKILSGVEKPDSGSIRCHPSADLDADDHLSLQDAVSVVQQDLALDGSLTVIENFVIGHPRYGTGLKPINWGRAKRELKEACDQLDFDVEPDRLVGTLSSELQSLVAVAKAWDRVMGSGRRGVLLILDEPTVHFRHHRSKLVLDRMRRLASTGCAVLFISHRFAEVVSICDRVMVLRNGRLSAQLTGPEITIQALVESSIGVLAERTPRNRATADPMWERSDVLRASELCGVIVNDLTFTVGSGEIVGVAGMPGMGQEELGGLLAGAVKRQSGSIGIQEPDGKPCGDDRVAYVTRDRVREGLWMYATATDNVSLPTLARKNWLSAVSVRSEREAAVGWIKALRVWPPRPEAMAYQFSGGNQQKLVMAKWLRTNPVVFILEEPTQGVDVGAKREILDLIVETAGKGAGVIIISSEHEELTELADRVLILRDGALKRTLTAPDFDASMIEAACHEV